MTLQDFLAKAHDRDVETEKLKKIFKEMMYRNFTYEHLDESEKAFFLRLRDWEIVHRNAFEKEYKLLREEWWEENSFAPY